MQNLEKDEMRRELPEKFRASTKAADKAAFELLQENDRRQRLLAEQINTPNASASSKSRTRSNALITIREYEEISKYQNLAPNQLEELAEAYAAVGQFNKAGETTLNPEKRAEFIKYHEAVWLDDEDWCDHGESAKYVKDHVWSIREGREMPLLACNNCGIFNVLDAPERLKEASARRAEIRAAHARMSEPEFNNFIEKYRREM